MSDIEVIHSHADGYTATGHSVSYTEPAYVKVNKTFRYKALGLLRGAPLSVFLEVALADEPPGVQTICANTRYGEHAVCEALDFLVERNFLEEIGRAGSNGVKRYRVISYAWNGSDRNAPPDADATPISSGHRIAKSAIRHKRDTTAESVIEPPESAIRRTRNAIRPVDVVGTSSNSDIQIPLEEKQQTTAAQRIFQRVGIFGVSLDRLRGVSVDLAEQWAEWIENAPSSIRNPQGIAIAALVRDATAQPPAAKKKKERFADSVHDLHEVQQTCGTMAHKYWAPDHGGCDKCGIKPRAR